jgi:hypothetical protein
MACVTIRRGDDLPTVCCVCGQAATRDRSETLTWTPPWVFTLIFFGVLPWLLAVMLTRRTADVLLPVCDLHRRRSRRSWWALALGLLLAVGIGCSADLVATNNITSGDVIAGAFLFGLLAVAVAVFLSDDRVRPVRIDDRKVTLDRVSDEFAQAVECGIPGLGGHTGARTGGMELATARYLRG